MRCLKMLRPWPAFALVAALAVVVTGTNVARSQVAAPAGALLPADQEAIARDARAASDALARLRAWLRPQGANGAAWERFLQVEQLQQQLASPQPDLNALKAISARFRSGHAGLKMPHFAAIDPALQQLIATIEVAHGGVPLAIEQARGAFRPVDQAAVASDAARLSQSIGRLRTRLRTLGALGTGWINFLKLTELEQQLQQPVPDLETLQTIYDNIRSGHPGLEVKDLHETAGNLQRLIATLEAHTAQITAEDYAAKLDELSQLVESFDEAPSAEQARQLSQIVEWLHDHRQAPRLVEAVRRHYSHSNLLLDVSEEFIASIVERPINSTAPVRDVILGAQVRGTARTVGRLTIDLVENPRAAVIEALLTGTNYSRTTSSSGPARVYARGTTLLRGRKRLSVTPTGIQTETAIATADLSNTITGVGATRGGLLGKIIRRAAAKEAGEKKALGERIAARHAEERLVIQLEDRAGEPLAKANREFLQRFRYPLMRRGRFPESLRFATTNNRLLVRALEEATSRLAAPLAPPQLSDEHDVAVRLHESLINNVTLQVLGGQKVSNFDLEDMAVETLGYIPDRLKEDDGDEWSITFNADEPVTVRVAGSEVHLIVRGDEFTSGEKVYQGMNISTTYALELSGGELRGTRPEKLEILPPDFDPASGQRLPLRLTVLRNLLQRRFGAMLPQEFVVDEIELEEPWNKAGNLVISEMQADQGWLLLAADPVGNNATASGAAAIHPAQAAR